jgi:hypothetical protein
MIPLAMRDQIGAAFRADLVSLGIDTAQDGALVSAIAGMAVGMKMLIQQGCPMPLLSHYVWVCETLVPMLSTEQTDLSSLPDVDFLKSLNLKPVEPFPETVVELPVELEVLRFACSKCGESDAIIPVGNYHFCLPCASEMVAGGMNALRLAGQPQVGGPGFNQESAHTEESVSPQASESTGHAKAPAEATTGGTVDTPPPPYEPKSWIVRWLMKREQK